MRLWNRNGFSEFFDTLEGGFGETGSVVSDFELTYVPLKRKTKRIMLRL